MSATHAHELNAAAQSGQPRGGPAVLLLVAALLLAILVGVLTLMRQHGWRLMPAPSTTSQTTSVIAPPAADTSAVAPASAATTPHRQRGTAAPLRDRQARPLAGNPSPPYPQAALRAGVEGSVVASLEVDARGRVGAASIVSHSGQPSRDLDRAVLNTVLDWRFEPAVRNGHAVASVVRVPVDFRTGH